MENKKKFIEDIRIILGKFLQIFGVFVLIDLIFGDLPTSKYTFRLLGLSLVVSLLSFPWKNTFKKMINDFFKLII